MSWEDKFESEIEKLNVAKEKIELFKEILEIKPDEISATWAMKHILGLSELEIKEFFKK